MGYIQGLVVNFGNSPELSINSLVKESTHFPFSYLPYLTTKFNFEKAIIIDESYICSSKCMDKIVKGMLNWLKVV